jgi:DHA3 family macrolide efflux protein-like MFS transporter
LVDFFGGAEKIDQQNPWFPGPMCGFRCGRRPVVGSMSMHMAIRRPDGMAAFSLIWFGQLVSLVGSAMTQFAIGIWAWQETGAATALALVTFFAFVPGVIVGPFAGALVDRWDRRTVLIGTDLVAGIASILILLLYSLGLLQIWHLYLAGFIAGVAQSFQWPAFSAAITTMVRREQYGRANGMMALAEAASAIVAPILAGLLIGFSGIGFVLAIDVATFLFAVGMMLLIAVPPPAASDPDAQPASLWSDAFFGFRYILARPGLLGLQLTFLVFNLLTAFSFGLTAPMVLARSGDDPQALGLAMTSYGVGGVIGGLVMSLWGGPRRQVYGVLLGMIASGVIGAVFLGFGQSLPFWMVGGVLVALCIPLVNGSNQAIWQARVPADLQGRVFAARRVVAQVAFPLGLILAGPLADLVFEPALREGGALTGSLGWLVGVGPGAGMGLMFVIFGLLSSLAALVSLSVPRIRQVELSSE